ncbi:hypothetical protein ABZP36_025156 [Zizania latifolia]
MASFAGGSRLAGQWQQKTARRRGGGGGIALPSMKAMATTATTRSPLTMSSSMKSRHSFPMEAAASRRRR